MDDARCKHDTLLREPCEECEAEAVANRILRTQDERLEGMDWEEFFAKRRPKDLEDEGE